MDNATFTQAKQAYNAQDWDMAVILFSQCGTGPGTGEACHLCGNALMRLGRVQEAVQAYKAATLDPMYPNKGAIYTNLGKAQMMMGDYYGAIESLRTALTDSNYHGAYKAQMALGEAYSKMGDPRSAGVAYRNAALENNNPDPAKSLINLGVCFMQLKRPADAAEAYRTALDFSKDPNECNLLYSNLGQAYVASNRMIEAVQAFEKAIEGGYELSPAARSDYERAKRVTDTIASSAKSGSNTEMFLQGFGQGQSFDPLDPLGRSGDVMPSPDDTGFFDMDDKDIENRAKDARKQDKQKKKQDRQNSHVGLKVLIAFLVVMVLLVAAALAAYLMGMGLPSQETTINEVFQAALVGRDKSDGWSAQSTGTSRAFIIDEISEGDSYEIKGLDTDAQKSTALVDVSLPEGGVVSYEVNLDRVGIGWKIASISKKQSAVDVNTFTDATSDPIGAVPVTNPEAVSTSAEQPSESTVSEETPAEELEWVEDNPEEEWIPEE
ncbi:MAG: tetratricopeptide repeat protein [Coriobacteriales bacterium]|nr:tetratricopeptide repeat protein [Coriobacteriales bacterium]